MFELYENLISEFKNDERCSGFKDHARPTADNYPQMAGTLYHHFPAHFYKAQDVISCYQKMYGEQASICEQESVVVVDVGAGVGTFCLALMDLVMQNKAKGASVCEKFYLILIEPNVLYHEAANDLLKQYVRKSKFQVKWTIIARKFPGEPCLSEVLEKVAEFDSKFVIIAMSNLWNWLDERSYLDILLPWRRKTETKTIYDRACNFLKEFMENTAALQVVLLSVETKKLELRWKLAKFYERLQQLLQDIYILQGPTANLITYENFPKSYYREKKNRITHTNTYRAAFAVFGLIVNRMSELENLKRAYFKSRQALRWEYPCDEVAFKLFERDLDRNLKQLGKKLLYGYKFGEFPLEYEVPKNNQETRPRVMDSLNDSIVGAVFLDVVGRGIDKNFCKVSYGNRINEKIDSEYMYKHFWHSYRNFMYKKISWFAKKGFKFFVKMDIKSFYPSINQENLVKKFVSLLPVKEPRVLSLVNSMINRSVFGSLKGYGLPQGPICSGFLANCYLDNFDHEMEAKLGPGAYQRYVDDMTIFTHDKKGCEAAINDAFEKLCELGLKIHEGKLKKGSIEDYMSLIKRDQELDNYQKELSRVLRGLYSLDLNNYRKFIKNPAEFVRLYSESLRNIGVFISPEWLRRKLFLGKGLSVALSLGARHFSSHMYRVRFPHPNKLSNPTEWVKDFKSKNAKLVKTLEGLKKELENRLHQLYDCYGNLETHEIDRELRKKITAKYRFYTYRASTLYTPGVVPILKKILLFPWLYNTTVLRSYPVLIPVVSIMMV